MQEATWEGEGVPHTSTNVEHSGAPSADLSAVVGKMSASTPSRGWIVTSNENERTPDPARPGEPNLADKVMHRDDDEVTTRQEHLRGNVPAAGDERTVVHDQAATRDAGDRPTDDETRISPEADRRDAVTERDTATERDATTERAAGSERDAGSSSAAASRPLFRDDTGSTDQRAADADATTVRPATGASHETGSATAGVAGATAAGTVAATSRRDEETRVQPVDDPATERANQRAERDRALGKVPVSNEPERTQSRRPPRTTDKFHGSLALFLLRLVVAAIMGVHGVQKLMNLEGTRQFFETTALRDFGAQIPYYAALATAIGEVAIALGLLVGFLTRIAGLGTAIIGVGALVLVKWLSNPVDLNGNGFSGELELLLAVCGLVFLLLGAGGWSIDAAMRRGRARKRAAT